MEKYLVHHYFGRPSFFYRTVITQFFTVDGDGNLRYYFQHESLDDHTTREFPMSAESVQRAENYIANLRTAWEKCKEA